MVMPEGFNFFFDLHELIFKYLEEELGITELEKPDFGNRVITIALFVRRRRKELLEMLKKYVHGD